MTIGYLTQHWTMMPSVQYVLKIQKALNPLFFTRTINLKYHMYFMNIALKNGLKGRNRKNVHSVIKRLKVNTYIRKEDSLQYHH